MCFVAPVFADGQAGGVRGDVRPLPRHRRGPARQHLAGRDRDLPGGHPDPADPDRAGRPLQRRGLPADPRQLALPARPGGRHPGDDRLLAARRVAAGASCSSGSATDVVLAAFDEFIASTAVDGRARAAAKLIPEGSFEFFDYVDSDGHGSPPDSDRDADRSRGRPDHRSTSRTAARRPRGRSTSSRRYSFINLLFARYLMSHDRGAAAERGAVPSIDELRTKPGTIVDPRFPAATGLRSHTRLRLSSCMLGAMLQARRAVGGELAGLLPLHAGAPRSRDREAGLCTRASGRGSGRGRTPTAWT